VSEAVLVERDGAVEILTLNRPDALNAIDADVATGLGNALDAADSDPGVRVVVITGAGRAFCAGMDLKAFASGVSVEPAGHPEWGFAGIAEHFVDTPIIAAVNGVAFGGGAEIALASDLVVADEAARFAFPEVTRGLFASAGGLLRLAQQLPQKIALELLLTGRPFSAIEAAEWGLVNRISPAGESLAVAIELARSIAANAPLAVRATKRLSYRTAAISSWEAEGDAAWQLNREEMVGVFTSRDAREGARAFAEKRQPYWEGK
jgi:enoyl-CoA hydratase/carnithine racemase